MRFKSAMNTLGSNSQGLQESVPTPTMNRALPDIDTAIAPITPTSSHQTPLLSPTVPSWAREVGAALVTRPSRASSIVSTRTRFSNTTIVQDDARSIDINLGGQFFRISRDGSHITSEFPPPPYPGPGEVATVREEESITDPSIAYSSLIDLRAETPSVAQTLRLRTISRGPNPQLDTSLRANILDPSEVDIPSPIGVLQSQQDPHTGGPSWNPIPSKSLPVSDGFPSRNPSYTTGGESITVIEEGRQRRTVSQNDLPEVKRTNESLSTPLRRRNGVRLPTLMTGQEHQRRKDMASPLSSLGTSDLKSHQSHSAGAAFPSGDHNSDISRSPTFIGKQATGIFPLPNFVRDVSVTKPWDQEASTAISRLQSREHNPNTSTDGVDEESVITAMDTENDISLHYTRMLRFVDREHRRTLHARDKELAELRERLNEVDTVYRQELKARDFIIDDLRKCLAHLKENTEELVEKARNQVEDVWESRWKDRDFHLMERMRRMEAEAQKNIERILADHDKT